MDASSQLSFERFADFILDEVEGALASIPKPKRRDRALIEEAARRAARSAVSEAWGKKPICKVMLTGWKLHRSVWTANES